jgi:hypothetical protein
MISQEDRLALLRDVEAPKLTQLPKESGTVFGQRGSADLIAAQYFRGFFGHRKPGGDAQFVIRACHEESHAAAELRQPKKIHVAAIHYLEGGLEERFVDPEESVLEHAGDRQAGQNRAAQIVFGIQLEATTYTSKNRLR